MTSQSYSLWFIETVFLLDILRKCFTRKAGSLATDSYDIFVEYLRGDLILDLISLIPQIFSGMD